MMFSSGKIVSKSINHFNQFHFRDAHGCNGWYNPIGVIEHTGHLQASGTSQGHYVCDVKEKRTNLWYKTNDDSYPIQIDVTEVSKHAYAILLVRTDEDSLQ